MTELTKRLVALAALALAASCSNDLTQLVVVVDSDLAVPGELDHVAVMVTVGSRTQTAEGVIRSASELPQIVNLVHREGPLGPVDVRATGTHLGTGVIVREARAFFVSGETRVLRIELDRACIGVTCGAGMTCAAGSCRSVDVPVSELLVYPAGVDHPTSDGGACGDGIERCNRMDDDCDGMVDEGFDLTSDPLDCGACMMACPFGDHGTPVCSAGACSLTCDPGFGDCDMNAANGCEASFDDPATCGSCTNPCDVPNATSTCTDGTCAFEACLPGFDDCDADTSNGCEVDLMSSADDCGACGTVCDLVNAVEACVDGGCAVDTCEDGFGDCNGDPDDGCELALTTLASCGACGAACAPADGVGDCATGTCEVASCNAGFGDCDADPANGCEQALSTLTDCGSCGTSCSLANATETCATGTCEVMTCNTNFGDCDSSPMNGCETNLTRSDANCGMCGNACTGGDRCRMSVCR